MSRKSTTYDGHRAAIAHGVIARIAGGGITARTQIAFQKRPKAGKLPSGRPNGTKRGATKEESKQISTSIELGADQNERHAEASNGKPDTVMLWLEAVVRNTARRWWCIDRRGIAQLNAAELRKNSDIIV